MGGCHDRSRPQSASGARNAHILRFRRNMSAHGLVELRAARARRQSRGRDIQSVEFEHVAMHPKSLAPLCSGFPGLCPCASDRTGGGRSYSRQRFQAPAGASGSSTSSAKLRVVTGSGSHSRDGEISAPSQVAAGDGQLEGRALLVIHGRWKAVHAACVARPRLPV